MEWISVKDRLPKPWEIVWIYWRDREVLLGCRVYEGKDELECEPSEGWYSLEDDKCKSCNFWQYYRIDKPDPPNYVPPTSDAFMVFKKYEHLSYPMKYYGERIQLYEVDEGKN